MGVKGVFKMKTKLQPLFPMSYFLTLFLTVGEGNWWSRNLEAR